ncbi:hypothetical protein M433DRAFT_138689 [Acidomyces richmondensis BFW]|nr:hypothetical protein M433DRAFT_138689 [Acidomyces richmondensis BFW]
MKTSELFFGLAGLASALPQAHHPRQGPQLTDSKWTSVLSGSGILFPTGFRHNHHYRLAYHNVSRHSLNGAVPTHSDSFSFDPNSEPFVSPQDAQIIGNIVKSSRPMASGSAFDASSSRWSSIACEEPYPHGGADANTEAAGVAAPTGHLAGGAEGRSNDDLGLSFAGNGSQSRAAASTAGHVQRGNRDYGHGVPFIVSADGSFFFLADQVGARDHVVGLVTENEHRGEGRASGSWHASSTFSFGGSCSAHASDAIDGCSKHHQHHHDPPTPPPPTRRRLTRLWTLANRQRSWYFDIHQFAESCNWHVRYVHVRTNFCLIGSPRS